MCASYSRTKILIAFLYIKKDCPQGDSQKEYSFHCYSVSLKKMPYLKLLMIQLFKWQLWIKKSAFLGLKAQYMPFIQECHYQSYRQDYTFIDCFSSSLHMAMILCPDLTSSSIISLCLRISMVNVCDLQKQIKRQRIYE